MKKIYKINQYLLENYPSLWNTKIVWMLLVSIVIHIFFFFTGLVSHSNPSSLHGSNAINDYFNDGLLFVQLIISLLMLVIWLVMMFKNNAFKNFYPSNKWKLFSQFLQYFIIIIACTTFYYSYMLGFKMFINSKYDDKSMTEKIDVINRAAPFLSQNLENYTIENRKYPEIFSKLYCEQSNDNLEYKKPYYSFFNRNYQFYSVYSKSVYKIDSLNGGYEFPEPEKSNETKVAFTDEKENYVIYYFKKEVIDLSKEIKTTNPSYLNYSKVFYFEEKGTNKTLFFTRSDSYNDYNGDATINFFTDSLLAKESYRINKNTAELLQNNKEKEIEKLLTDFLQISKDFSIENNLDVKSWARLINKNDNFEVENFIKTYNYSYEKNGYAEAYPVAEAGAAVPVDAAATTPDYPVDNETDIDKYYKERITQLYYSDKSLSYMLENITEIKNSDIFSDSVHLFFWFAFGLACFIFCFRVTNLRLLLFSIVTAGVLILMVSLVGIFFKFTFMQEYKGFELFMSYFLLLLGSTILFLPIFRLKRLKKEISGVLINITICGFILYVLLYFVIFSMHQDQSNNNLQIPKPENIIQYLGLYLSYILLICGFVFMYFYSAIIQKWRALAS